MQRGPVPVPVYSRPSEVVPAFETLCDYVSTKQVEQNGQMEQLEITWLIGKKNVKFEGQGGQVEPRS